MSAPESFSAAAAAHRAYLVAFARHCGVQPADAEDVVQVVLVRCWRHWAGFRGDCTVRTWLGKAVQNAARNHHARRVALMRDVRCTVSLDADARPGANIAAEPAPESLDQPLFAHALHRAHARLRPHHAQILAAVEEHGETYEAIAAQSGVSMGTVKSRIFRARAQLARALRRDPIAAELIAA